MQKAAQETEKIPKAGEAAAGDVGVKRWLVQRHSCTASLGHPNPSAKASLFSVGEKTKEWLLLLQNSRTKKLHLCHLNYFSAKRHTDGATRRRRVMATDTELACAFHTWHLFAIHTREKMLPGIFCKAHNLVSFQIWGWNSIPATPGGPSYLCPTTPSGYNLSAGSETICSLHLPPTPPPETTCAEDRLSWISSSDEAGSTSTRSSVCPAYISASENVACLLCALNYIQ